jgi:cation diffusion facilitator family transporter
LWLTLALNLGAAAVKLIGGGFSGSIALVAGGVDSAFDGLANVAALAATRVAARPPDEDHPYGHRKFETLVAVVIGILLLLTCGRLAWEALLRLAALAPGATGPLGALAPEAPPLRVDGWVLAAPVVAFALNLLASTYEARRGRALGSELLVADAGHTRADALVSVAIVGGLLAVRAGWTLADPLLALGVAVVVARVGWSIVRDTADVLADAAVLDPEAVAEAAAGVQGVAGTHKVRSRGTFDAVAVDLHVQVDPHLGIGRAHAIGHAVQDRLRERFPAAKDVVVHVEPEWALADGAIGRRVRRALAGFDVEAHEIVVHASPSGFTEVALHLELDPQQTLGEAHAVADEVEAAVAAAAPSVDRVITHLEPRHGATETVHAAAGRDWEGLLSAEVARVDGLWRGHDVEAVRVGGGVRLSAHVYARGDLSLGAAHALAEQLERRLCEAAPELERVTVHLEPGERPGTGGSDGP